MLRDFIIKQNKSVYSIAKESGCAYTTLNELVLGKKNPEDCSIKTIAKLAEYFGLTIGEMYAVIVGKDNADNKQASKDSAPAISTSWQDARRKKYSFPIVIGDCDWDVSSIHPLKQRTVAAIRTALADDDRVESVVVFGSATTIRCNKKSDVDVAVNLREGCADKHNKNEISEIIQEICGYNADVLWMDRIKPGSQLYGNIERGVRII